MGGHFARTLAHPAHDFRITLAVETTLERRHPLPCVLSPGAAEIALLSIHRTRRTFLSNIDWGNDPMIALGTVVSLERLRHPFRDWH